MKQTAFERGQFVLNKIAAQWSKNNKSVSAAVTAAGETGRAHVGNFVDSERADRFVRGGFNVRLIDEKHWPEVYGAFLNGRASLVTHAELQEQYFPAAANDNNRFNITWFDDVGQTVTKDELVKGLLGTGEFSLFVAKPGMGKSVLVGDIGCHIAAGLDWHGRKVKQGLVVFFAAERKPLTERRIAAWAKKHGVTNIPFVVVGGKLDLTTGLADATALAKTIADLEAQSGHPCVLCILDTVTRTFGPGDQHQSRDMQRYIQAVDTLSRATGAHVAAIHHSPWSDDRGKGAIDLDGAVDASFVVNTKGSGMAKVFTLECTGANDGQEGAITSFILESVPLGTDADGNVTSAPVVVQASTSPADGSNLKGSRAKAFDSLERAIEEHGECPDDGPTSVTRDQWRDRYYADTKAKAPSIHETTLRSRFNRAIEELVDKEERVETAGDRFWIAVA
jgi:AAA domain